MIGNMLYFLAGAGCGVLLSIIVCAVAEERRNFRDGRAWAEMCLKSDLYDQMGESSSLTGVVSYVPNKEMPLK
jgi:hypothetical protein